MSAALESVGRDKQELRSKIAADIAAFEARGGTIEALGNASAGRDVWLNYAQNTSSLLIAGRERKRAAKMEKETAS